MKWTRRAMLGVVVAALVTRPGAAQEIHFSPEDKLDLIDVRLIAGAKSTIDLASYALTDRVVLNALLDAEKRGVAIRIVLDPRERHDFVSLEDLSDNVRICRFSVPLSRTGRDSRAHASAAIGDGAA